MGALRNLSISTIVAVASMYCTIRAIQTYEPPAYSEKEQKYIEVQNALTRTLQTYISSVQDQKDNIDSLVAEYPVMSNAEFDALSEKNAQGQKSNHALMLGMFTAIACFSSSAFAIANIKPAIRDYNHLKLQRDYFQNKRSQEHKANL